MKRIPALFCYRNADTIVHRIPAPIKLLFLVLVTLRTFSKGTYGLSHDFFIPLELIPWLRLAFYFCASLALFFAAKTPFASLARLKFVLYLGICLFGISFCSPQITQADDGSLLFALNVPALKNDALYIARFLVTVLVSLVVFETTSRIQILDVFVCIENALSRVVPPVKKLHLALVFSVALTFIPEVFACWERVRLASAARTPLKKNGKRAFCAASLSAQMTAFFLNMLQYAEEVRRAICNRL